MCKHEIKNSLRVIYIYTIHTPRVNTLLQYITHIRWTGLRRAVAWETRSRCIYYDYCTACEEKENVIITMRNTNK